MSEVHISLNQAQNEGIDSRMLPEGVLAKAENVRLRVDNRFVSRYGIAKESTATFTGYSTVRQAFSHRAGQYDQQVVIVPRTTTSAAVAYLRAANAGTYAAVSAGSTVAVLGDLFTGVERQHLFSGQTVDSVETTDCVFDASGNLWCLVLASGVHRICRVDVLSGAVTFSVNLNTTAHNGRILLVGSNIVAVYAADNGSGAWYVYQTCVNTSSLNATTTSVRATASADAKRWDVFTCSSTEYAFVEQQAADVVFDVNIYTVVATTAIATLKTAFSGPVGGVFLGVACNATLTCVAWIEAGYVTYAVVNSSSGDTVVSPTTIYASSAAIERPLCGYDSNAAEFLFAFNAGSAGTQCMFVCSPTAVRAYAAGVFVVSRPTTIGNGTYVWAEDNATYSARGYTPSRSTYYLVGLNTTGTAATTLEAQSCILGGILHLTTAQTRRGIAVRTSTTAPSQTEAFVCLPTWGTEYQSGAEIIRVEAGQWVDTGGAVHCNGQTILPGAVVREWSGTYLVESGLSEGPRWTTCAGGAAGNVDVGTHTYCVVWEWRDEQGRRHRSPPGPIGSVTISSSAKKVAVSFDDPSFTGKIGLTASIYRTEAGGVVYYQCGSMAISPSSGGLNTFTDDIADATLISNETLYTQGASGSLSGLLPNDAAPAARYACASSSRVLLGGLEQPNAVQWSKLVIEGEPVQWSIDEVYRASVDGRVTGVACLDGSWIVFTRDSIWEFVGAGPDDTGNGSFGEARKRPSDTGCISHRSIVECSLGLLFQGTNGGIWLLPRGGNAPVWIGQPVRATLETYSLISGAVLAQAENCIYFSCLSQSAGPVVSAGKLVVFDVRNQQWYVDTWPITPPHASRVLTTVDGWLRCDGVYAQTPGAYLDDDGSSDTVQPAIETGNIHPFGENGWGRLRKFHLAGSQLSALCALLCKVSYDGGVSWTDNYTFVLSGSVGTDVELQMGPSRVRGSDYRLRVEMDATGPTGSAPGAGVALNSISLEVYKQDGLKRMEASKRG